MSQGQLLFNRAWAVTIGLASTAGFVGGAAAGAAAGASTAARRYSSFSVNGQPASPLRVIFDIDKMYSSVANKATIQVYNLSSISRLLYQQADPSLLTNGYQIQLEAGYSGFPSSTPLVRTIYFGDIRLATNKRQGPDIITTFECGAAEKQLFLTTFDMSYPKGTTYLKIVQDMADAMNVPFGTVIGISKLTYNHGVTFSGTVKTGLDTVLRKTGLEWSIQDNSLNIKPIVAHNNDPVVVVSNQVGPNLPGLTGLIGVPSQNQGITQFTSLLNPTIIPGTPVQIWSENIRGNFFQVRRAHFEGDTHSTNKWMVACEAVPVNETQAYAQNKGSTLVAQ